MTTDTSRMPYQLPFPPEAADEVLVSPAVPEDERVWVPQAEGLRFRPLLLQHAAGLLVQPAAGPADGVLVAATAIRSRCTGYVIKGRWHYLEHDWVAEPGALRVRAAGRDAHPRRAGGRDGDDHLLHTSTRRMIYVDPWGETTGYEDVFTKIDMCRKHYEEVGLGADYVDQFIR